MSAENVALVRGLLPGPGTDLIALYRDDDAFAAWADAVAPVFSADFGGAGNIGALNESTRHGLEGLREGWLDWLAPWVTYRTEIEELVDLGELVLVLVRDFARREPEMPEVELVSGAVWTVRDGKVAWVEFFPDRDSALKAVGLAAQPLRAEAASDVPEAGMSPPNPNATDPASERR